MIPLRRLPLFALAASLSAGSACAQVSVQTQGSVTVLDPAQIARETDLSVADVARPAAGSRITNATAGSYTVVGQGGETFNVSAPTSLTLVRAGGTEEIQLSLKLSGSQGAFTGAVDQVSAAKIGIGGTVPVSSTTVPGAYQGKYTVTLAYQ
ncbi:MAG: DUF4402 domain-containing protein [Phenylobacterium sp.]